MSEAVVDWLEVIEIDKDDGNLLLAMARLAAIGLFEAVVEQATVGQFGQAVVTGLAREFVALAQDQEYAGGEQERQRPAGGADGPDEWAGALIAGAHSVDPLAARRFGFDAHRIRCREKIRMPPQQAAARADAFLGSDGKIEMFLVEFGKSSLLQGRDIDDR